MELSLQRSTNYEVDSLVFDTIQQRRYLILDHTVMRANTEIEKESIQCATLGGKGPKNLGRKHSKHRRR